jgi:hypothetical protein
VFRRPGILFSLAAAGALASSDGGVDADPPATQLLDLEVGKTAPMTETAGANILCDDPAVAAPEYADGGNAIVVRGLKPGTTLCGVWLLGPKPGGLYRVRVAAATAPPTDAGPDR